MILIRFYNEEKEDLKKGYQFYNYNDNKIGNLANSKYIALFDVDNFKLWKITSQLYSKINYYEEKDLKFWIAIHGKTLDSNIYGWIQDYNYSGPIREYVVGSKENLNYIDYIWARHGANAYLQDIDKENLNYAHMSLKQLAKKFKNHYTTSRISNKLKQFSEAHNIELSTHDLHYLIDDYIVQYSNIKTNDHDAFEDAIDSLVLKIVERNEE